MVTIKIQSLGDFQMKAIHGPSGVELITDPPVDNRGKGRSFSPTDLAATALGSCLATILEMRAGENNIDLGTMTVNVTKEMTSTPVRRIGKLTVDLNIPVTISKENQQKLEEKAKCCPVCLSLHPDIEVIVNFKWGK